MQNLLHFHGAPSFMYFLMCLGWRMAQISQATHHMSSLDPKRLMIK